MIKKLNWKNTVAVIMQKLKIPRKGVTGYAIYLFRCLIVRKSKSQISVALSTSEAKYF
jgi:hypothetical protein